MNKTGLSPELEFVEVYHKRDFKNPDNNKIEVMESFLAHKEKRKAYCFCNLVREADNPQIDPIFCYRAAGWDRQCWEPILEVEFKKCKITHSILKGDDFCAWDFYLE
jgi:hypothetical protein